MIRLYIFLFIVFSFSASAKPAQVAIVIDDIGYRATDKQVLTIPGNITYSVLPQTPYGKRIAEVANNRAHDVILHIPMESTHGKKLGPGALTSDMDENTLKSSLAQSFKEMPFALGINNHMGSHLTTLAKPMLWTMEFLKERELFFLDSVTSSKTLGRKIAGKIGVPAMSRHVFLDNHLNHDYIAGQFKQLITKAKKNQLAIAIAHPHPETVASLTKLIPLLKSHNIELVPLSKLYPAINQTSALTAQAE
ncbi:divergent polysaccharide deacetylase family protein [Thalassotalea algicola]|uniref:divergent polysaccharide deacetylase family protein n=1 Tax=Thalassotalea algicola TaxID=2716224 RepID=UPI002E2B57CB|nr:divergent polysaccharide deacetylase family protein [Thalassotalea algicola]